MKDRYTSPFRLFLFLLSILVILFLAVYFLPSGLDIGFNITIRVPQYSQLMNDLRGERRQPYQPVISARTEKDFSYFQPLHPEQVEDFLFGSLDTLEFEIPETPYADASVLRTSVFSIQYGAGFLQDLHQFFSRLNSLRSAGKVLRVLHYGDSQIEGDRVTAELRHLMQGKFGGMGPGMMSVVPLMRQHTSFRLNYTGNWNRYSFQPGELNHNRLGVLFSLSRFTQSGEWTNNDVEVTFSLQSRSAGYQAARRFRTAKLFFGYHLAPVYVEFSRTGQLIDADIFAPENNLKVMQYTWREPVGNLTIKMIGKNSPDIYAIALDDNRGVAVDNIPLRGSSGLEFTRSDTAFLRKMFGEFNTGMILLQFGVNVVPNIVSDYNYYEISLRRQLQLLKKINPGVPIIVLGVSDMSMMTDGVYRSYPNIELIRDAQKNAAFAAGCGFWDTYEAMGGENSMAAWAFADPPLAQKDFTHFSYQGSRLIGQMFWNALLSEYENFENLKKKKIP